LQVCSIVVIVVIVIFIFFVILLYCFNYHILPGVAFAINALHESGIFLILVRSSIFNVIIVVCIFVVGIIYIVVVCVVIANIYMIY